MTTPLPTDEGELEALAEQVRAFLRASRPIPIVIIEKREPEGREDWKTSRHRAALAQIESCCLVPSEACTRAEELASYGVSHLNYVELDRDLVVPTDVGDLLPTHFGGPRRHRPLPPGGIRVSSADSSWPWGHLISVAKVNLEACRQDAEDLAERLERRDPDKQGANEETKLAREPRGAEKQEKPSTIAQEDRRKVLVAIRDGCKNWAEVAKHIGRNASTVRSIGAALISDGLVEKDGNTKSVRMLLTAAGRRAVDRKK